MAGSLLQDDYNEFARQARLMTSIHAPIPFVMKQFVLEAKQRGEDPGMAARIENEQQPEESKQQTKTTSLVMKKKPAAPVQNSNAEMADDCIENMDDDDDCKENDPSLSPEPPILAPVSKRTGLGKRPLSVIPTTPVLDTDIIMLDSASDDENMPCDGMSASERNIAANSSSPSSQNSLIFSEQNTRQQTSSRPFPSFNNDCSSYAIYEDNGSENINPTMTNGHHRRPTFGKENMENALFASPKEMPTPNLFPAEIPTLNTGVFMKPLHPSLSYSSLSSSSSSSFLSVNNVNKTRAKKPFAPTKVTKPASHHSSGSGVGAGARKAGTGNKGKPRTGLRRL
jgi:ubiquitin-conjugating enzyme E2 S